MRPAPADNSGLAASGRKSAGGESRSAKSDTLKRKADNQHTSTAAAAAAANFAAKSETLKRKSDGGHQIFGTAEFNSRNRRNAAPPPESAVATLRRKSEDSGSSRVRSGVAAADELSEYLLRQSLDNSSYGLFSGRKSADKADGFTTVHFSEIPRARLASTGK
jgi:hypothetical protein